MSRHRISEESTIYHYTLLMKFTSRNAFYRAYSFMLVLWLMADIILDGVRGACWFAASFVLTLLVHAFVVGLLRRFARGTVSTIWAWACTFPFFGYLPAGYVPSTAWLRANGHRFMIGLVLIGLLYVWLPTIAIANLAAAHYFVLLPQLVYVRKCIALHKQSLIKINPQDISCYKN